MMPAHAPVRLGLIGIGRWGRIYMRTTPRIADARLVAAAGADPDGVAALPPGCSLYSHWRDLLAHDRLDGVIIAAPADAHAEIAAAAIQAGLAALVEKPLTQDLGQARDLVRLAQAAQAIVAVDHIHLFAPAFRRLKELLPRIGPVRAIRGQAGNHGPYRPDCTVLWDWGPHDVSMALDLMGRRPDHCAARMIERRRTAGGIGETVALHLRFGAVAADFTFSTLIDKTRRFQVEGEAGSLVYDDLAADKLLLNGKPEPIDPTPPLDCVVRAFIDRIRNQDRSPDQLIQAATVVEILSTQV